MEGKLNWYLPGECGGPDVLVNLSSVEGTDYLAGIVRDLKFKDYWQYKKSTKNQRIKSFWSRLAKAKTQF